jgi:hypothetical protein
MKKYKTASTAKMGDSYQRTKYEVHTLSDNGTWTVWGHFNSLEIAKEMYVNHLQRLQDVKWVFDTGHNPKVRFVEAKTICTVVA